MCGCTPAACTLCKANAALRIDGRTDQFFRFDRSYFWSAQGWEIWQAHRDWVTQHKPVFGPGTKERFEWVATLQQEEWQQEDANRTR